MGNRHILRDTLSQSAIAAHDPDGIATYFYSLVDWLFFGPDEEDGTPFPVPPSSHALVASLQSQEVFEDWKGWLPTIFNLLDLFDPDLCPAKFLPHLSRLSGLSTQLFHAEADLDETAKRQMIKDSVSYARVKGVPLSLQIFFRSIGWRIQTEALWLDLRTVGVDPPPGKSSASAWPLPADPEPAEGYYFDRTQLMAGTGRNGMEPPDGGAYWRRVNQIDTTFQRTLGGQEPLEEIDGLLEILRYVVPIYLLVRNRNIGEYIEDEVPFGTYSDEWGAPNEIHGTLPEYVIPYNTEEGAKCWSPLYYDDRTASFLDYSGTLTDEFGQPYTYRGYPERCYPVPYAASYDEIFYDGVGIADYEGTYLDPYGEPYTYGGYPAMEYLGNTLQPSYYELLDELLIGRTEPVFIDPVIPWLVVNSSPLEDFVTPPPWYVRSERPDVVYDGLGIPDYSGSGDWGFGTPPLYAGGSQLTPFDALHIQILGVGNTPVYNNYVLDDDVTQMIEYPSLDLARAWATGAELRVEPAGNSNEEFWAFVDYDSPTGITLYDSPQPEFDLLAAWATGAEPSTSPFDGASPEFWAQVDYETPTGVTLYDSPALEFDVAAAWATGVEAKTAPVNGADAQFWAVVDYETPTGVTLYDSPKAGFDLLQAWALGSEPQTASVDGAAPEFWAQVDYLGPVGLTLNDAPPVVFDTARAWAIGTERITALSDVSEAQFWATIDYSGPVGITVVAAPVSQIQFDLEQAWALGFEDSTSITNGADEQFWTLVDDEDTW